MRSDPSGAGSGPSETQKRTRDTTDGLMCSSGAAHRQGAPATSPIATPAFLVVPPAVNPRGQHGTPCVPTPQRPRNAPATPTDSPTRSSGAAHRQKIPNAGAIAAPAFHEELRPVLPTSKHGTPHVPTNQAPAPAPQRPRNAPATPPTVLRAPPVPRIDRKHLKPAPSTLPLFSWCQQP